MSKDNRTVLCQTFPEGILSQLVWDLCPIAKLRLCSEDEYSSYVGAIGPKNISPQRSFGATDPKVKKQNPRANDTVKRKKFKHHVKP